ncbi:MAG: ECF transporter S component [Anaerolineae bacterium]|nr:ECF transporter S component [Anaerolineae bacterium]
MENIRKDFTTITWVMIPVAIAVNVVIGQLVVLLKLPVYLDSIGTVLVGLLAGPWAGALTGILSNLVWSITGLFPQAWAWIPVAAVIGIMAGLFGRRFKQLGWWLIGGLLTGIIAALLSAPISAAVFGGVTGTGQDFLVGFFRATGASILEATFGQGIVSDPLDKTITFLIVYLVVRALPARFLDRFPRSENVV